MLTTDKKELADIADQIRALALLSVLVEDPTSGLIQLNPEMYIHIGRATPTNPSNNAQRAKSLVGPYQKLWPAKIASGGRPIRQGPVALIKKLTVFLNKHPKVTEQQILDATTRYIAMKAKENYNYMVCSDYFIEKGSTSVLESYITNPELGSKALESAKAINQRFI